MGLIAKRALERRRSQTVCRPIKQTFRGGETKCWRDWRWMIGACPRPKILRQLRRWSYTKAPAVCHPNKIAFYLCSHSNFVESSKSPRDILDFRFSFGSGSSSHLGIEE